MGQGSISYSQPPGGPGGIVVAGARNGLSVDPLSFIVLGQDIGEAGDPATLLSDREIPMDTFNLSFPNFAGGILTIHGDNQTLLELNRSTSNDPFLQTITTKPSPGPGQNGNFFITIDESFVNPDGQIDAVMEFGYNQSGGGGPHDLSQPAHWLAFESHFQAGGGAQMEFHYQSASTNGNVNRHISITPNIITGDAIGFSQINSYFWQKNNDTLIYFGVGDDGGMILNGPNTFVNWTNTDPTFGQLAFAFNALGSVQIGNGTTGPNSTIGFSNNLKIENSNINFASLDIPLPNTPNSTGVQIDGTVAGNAFPRFVDVDVSGTLFDHFENLNAVGNTAQVLLTALGTGEIYTKWAFKNGGAFEGFAAGLDQQDSNNFKIAYGTGVLTDANVLTITPGGLAGFGGNTAPPAWISSSPGTAATGPLNIPPGTLTAVAVDGNVENDGTNFYVVLGGVRRQIVVI